MTDYVPSADLQARVIARRGQLHAFSHMAPQRTALVDSGGSGHLWCHQPIGRGLAK